MKTEPSRQIPYKLATKSRSCFSFSCSHVTADPVMTINITRIKKIVKINNSFRFFFHSETNLPQNDQRWALDWTWIALDPRYTNFLLFWIGSWGQIASKFKIGTRCGLRHWKKIVALLMLKSCILSIFWAWYELGLYLKIFWAVETLTEFLEAKTGSGS